VVLGRIRVFRRAFDWVSSGWRSSLAAAANVAWGDAAEVLVSIPQRGGRKTPERATF
jgi:hypothetical protein